MRDVFDTGYGIKSAIGQEIEANFETVCVKKNGIHPIQRLATKISQMAKNNEEHSLKLDISSEQKMPRSTLFAIQAIETAQFEASKIRYINLNGTETNSTEMLTIQIGVIFPNLNFSEPIDNLGVKTILEVIKNQNIKHVLSNSFGFEGNDTSLLFSKL